MLVPSVLMRLVARIFSSATYAFCFIVRDLLIILSELCWGPLALAFIAREEFSCCRLRQTLAREKRSVLALLTRDSARASLALEIRRLSLARENAKDEARDITLCL